MAGEVSEFLQAQLEKNFGKAGKEMFRKSLIKKPLSEHSDLGDVCEFIGNLEKSMALLYGKAKAHEVCNNLKAHAKHSFESSKPPVSPQTRKDPEYEGEIRKFIQNNPYPSDEDINDFAKFLILGMGNETRLTQENMEHMTGLIRVSLTKEKVIQEIGHFLDNFASPKESDINDFSHYLNVMGLDFDPSELPGLIEKQRLFRKFSSQRPVKGAYHHANPGFRVSEYPLEPEEILLQDIDQPDKKHLEATLASMGFDHMIKKDKS